jgi:hypothetical protein
MNQRRRIALYIDPPSLSFLRDQFFNLHGATHAGDQILAPYAYLRSYLAGFEIPVHTADYLPAKSNGVRNVYISIGNTTNYKRISRRKDTVLSAFFAMECPTVEPKMYRELSQAQSYFKRIFSWSDASALEPFVGGTLRCELFRWPQSFDSVHEEIWRRTERGFLVMINGNKLPRFKYAGRELYSERMRALEYFSQTGEIDLYGVGWDGPSFITGQVHVPGTFGKVPLPGTVQRINRQLVTYWQHFFPDPRLVAARRVYHGFATSKAETLGRYKFALCFENSILKGWVTEKIFDCFFAGTVPVYWGAPNIHDYVPAECFIDMRRFKDYGELKSFLRSLTDQDIARYREQAREFLGSPAFQPFTKRAFAQIFAHMIEEDTGVKLTTGDPEPVQVDSPPGP